MVMSKYEIKAQQERQDWVVEAIEKMIVEPYTGTHTRLLTVLRSYIPPHIWFKPYTPRALSVVLSAVEQSGRLSGWGVYRWRTADTRMISLVPPGWVWDNAGRRWSHNGVPV